MCCTCNIDWAAVSAIATLVMAIATFFTIRQSRKQLDEMKRQWDEERKPRIRLSIENYGMHCYLKVENLGLVQANNVKLSIDPQSVNYFNTVIPCDEELGNNGWVVAENITIHPFEPYSCALFHATDCIDFGQIKIKMQIGNIESEHCIDFHSLMLDIVNHKV